jgi:hypothetical protein
MDLSEADQATVARACAWLRRYPVPTEPSSKLHVGHRLYIDPKVLVQAALDFAPTTAGKVRIAAMIKETVNEQTDIISNFVLEKLAKQLFTNLLVPRLFLHLRS